MWLCCCYCVLCVYVRHIYRLYTDYMGWSLDATMVLMIWTVKACTFAYNVSDGQALNAGLQLSERASTHTFRAERAITKIPNLLEYFSYVFFFGGVLCGPCFEAKEYFDFIDGALMKKHKLNAIPNTIIASLKCVGIGLLMYIGMIIAGMYPIMNFVSTPAFGSMAFLPKFAYFTISITASRFKYYFAWNLGEAGCVATGFGFDGALPSKSSTDPVVYRWDRVSNCSMLAVETAPHMTDVTNNWNMGVNNWLKNYVYFRVEAPSAIVRLGVPSKTFTNLVTKATSAFWHGFYPSYYLFFLGAWLAGEMDDAMRASFEGEVTAEQRKARAKSWWKGPINLYELISFVLSQTTLNFWGICFVLLRADHAFEFGKNMYFIGIWLPIVVAILCKTMFRKKKVKKEVTTTTTTITAAAPATATTAAPAVVESTTVAASATRVPSTKKAATVVVEDATAEDVTPTVRVRRTRSNKAE